MITLAAVSNGAGPISSPRSEAEIWFTKLGFGGNLVGFVWEFKKKKGKTPNSLNFFSLLHRSDHHHQEES